MVKSANISADQLASIVSRVEKLLEDRRAISDDIKDVWAEAKGNGFDVKTLKKIIKLRAMEASRREEEETLLDLYMRTLGMSPSLDDDRGESSGSSVGRL